MNIVLIGFMGCGKTTIGALLAQTLNMKLMDTDVIIEKQGVLIPEIFNRFGEEYFRQLERQTIASLVDIDNCVVSVGGGAIMFYDNLRVLKQIGQTVFLDAPLCKIFNNLHGKFRPLVGNTIDERKLSELYNKRYSTYKQADIIIDTTNHTPNQTVDEILRIIRSE